MRLLRVTSVSCAIAGLGCGASGAEAEAEGPRPEATESESESASESESESESGDEADPFGEDPDGELPESWSDEWPLEFEPGSCANFEGLVWARQVVGNDVGAPLYTVDGQGPYHGVFAGRFDFGISVEPLLTSFDDAGELRWVRSFERPNYDFVKSAAVAVDGAAAIATDDGFVTVTDRWGWPRWKGSSETGPDNVVGLAFDGAELLIFGRDNGVSPPRPHIERRAGDGTLLDEAFMAQDLEPLWAAPDMAGGAWLLYEDRSVTPEVAYIDHVGPDLTTERTYGPYPDSYYVDMAPTPDAGLAHFAGDDLGLRGPDGEELWSVVIGGTMRRLAANADRIAIIVDNDVLRVHDHSGALTDLMQIDINCVGMGFDRQLRLTEVSLDDQDRVWLVGRIRGANDGYRSWIGLVALP